MIHRSFVSVVLVVTFVSAVSFRSFRWFRFGVLGFSTCQNIQYYHLFKFDGTILNNVVLAIVINNM